MGSQTLSGLHQAAAVTEGGQSTAVHVVCVCVRVCVQLLQLLCLPIPSLQGHAVVADLKVLSWSETAPHDYFNIATTHDDSMCCAC